MLRAESHAYDAARSIETAGIVPLEGLSIDEGRRDSGFIYVPTGPRIFDAFRRALPDDLSRHTFIDLGSGKGRTLILAVEAGVGRAIGVEFASELTAVAHENLRAYEGPADTGRITCVNADAGAYDLPPGPLVIYLHNPFAEDVMERVLANVRESLEADPREIWLCYLQLRNEDPGDETRNVELVEESGLFRRRPVPRGGLRDRLILSPFDLRAYVAEPAA